MAKCPNKNTGEYRALQDVYNTELSTNDVINTWQELNDTDAFPTVLEAEEMVNDQKIAFALKQKDFADSLFTNLRRERIGSMYQGVFFLNNSNPATREYDEMFLSSNLKRLKRYLEINNIPESSVNILKTPKSFMVQVNEDLLTPKDLIEKSRSWDTNRSRAVVLHLKKMFPQIGIQMLSVAEGRNLFDSLPNWKKNNVKYRDVKSFYNDGVAYLIKGRVTDETAIEEILHPFIDAVKAENEGLFNSLLGEVTANFPVMVQQIEAEYNQNTRNFNQVERDLEIVTQGLAGYFKKEYENTPTTRFQEKIKELLEWFKKVINNLNEYITGRPLTVDAINSESTMSDVAKLLNTEGIQFKLNKRVDGKVRFSLSPKKQKLIDKILSESSGAQKTVIKRLFHQAMTTDQVIDSFSANRNSESDGSTIVTLNKADHTYVDITGGEIYTSVTTGIKGKLRNQKDVQLNLDIGNDVDLLLDVIVSRETITQSVLDQMNVLNEEQARKAYDQLDTTLKNIMPEGSVALSQVVVFDEATSLAGTADLVIVQRDGKIRIVDLKTSKNSLNAQSIIDTKAGRQQKSYYDNEWSLKAKLEDAIQDLKNSGVVMEKGNRYSEKQIEDRRVELSSDLYKKGVDKLSTRAQHNLQVNLYRRMFENMGYDVYDGTTGAATTIHFTADITGKGANQKFTGKMEYDQKIDHPPGENRNMVDMLVPLLTDSYDQSVQQDATKAMEDAAFKGAEQVEEDATLADQIEANKFPEYNTIAGVLTKYQSSMIDTKNAIEQVRSAIYMDKTQAQEQESLALAVAFITIAQSEGPIARSVAFTKLLQDAIGQVRSFTEYIQDPRNVGKPEYITYVINFDRFITKFKGLHTIDAEGIQELNATQRSLVLTLGTSINKLTGGSSESDTGLVRDALNDYVKEVIRTRSSNEFGADGSFFTKDDLDAIIFEADDISLVDLYTRDMATSTDVMLAVMDKIYKAKKQELLDKIGQRETLIRKAGQKLLKLSNNSDLEKLYDFMLEYNDEGVFTGFCTKRIGQQYFDMQDEIRSELYDNEGNPYIYRDIVNLEDASNEDIKYNIDLANKKRALSDFFRAEIKDQSDNPVDGEYHGYTKEFKDARDIYEYWVPGSESNSYGNWYRKPGVSDAKYAAYEAKYYDMVEYTRAVRVSGEAIGSIIKDQTFRAAKKKFVFRRDTSRSGKDMTSNKYGKIMSPTNALEQAQKEFYQLFVNMFEGDLLKMLPGGVMNQMTGRVPLVMNSVLNELKGKSSIHNKIYAATVGSRAWNTFKKTSSTKGVSLDENNNLVNSMPIFYTGVPRLDSDLDAVSKLITEKKDELKKGDITKDDYDTDMKALRGRQRRLRSQPSLGQISTDLTSSLLKFSAMAQNFETMSTVEDTMNAFVKVIENRDYQPSGDTKLVTTTKEGVKKVVGVKASSTSPASNVERRAKKWMNMVFYDNEIITKGAFDKLADGLIQLSSLSYVAFNPFGNFNNYVIGRINNNIEMLGGRFYNKRSYIRSSAEFNKKALMALVQRTSYSGDNTRDLADLATFGLIPGLAKSDYDPKKANNKWEGFVDMFRMMDSMSDLREQGAGYETTQGRSWFDRASEWGYVMQDAAEYNVQTKVGMAMLMDIMVVNQTEGHKNFGNELPFYDAFTYNSETHTNDIKEGYNKIIFNGVEQDYTDQVKYEIRNKIREVNKQIHGNYAKEDRMVIQSNTIGNLAAQFKKWVAPAVRARYQREYFDQNLGWMEGRYISFFSFLGYAKREIMRGNIQFSTYGQGFMEAQTKTITDKDGVKRTVGYDGKGGNADQRAQNKLFGFYRTMGEIGIILSTLAISMILDNILADDDDDDLTKRLKNMVKYQAQRAYKETVIFNPIPGLGGYTQMRQMFDSPLAASRTMGELAEAMYFTVATPLAYTAQSKDKFYSNSTHVYQRGGKKGSLKVYKNWKDVLPIIYSIQKYNSYLQNDDFYMGTK